MASAVATAGRWIGIALMLGGLGLLGWGCSSFAGTVSTWATGETAQGRVVEVQSRQYKARGGAANEVAIVEYRTAAGATIRFEDRVGATRSAYRTGEQVKVWYRPSAPEAAVIAASSPISLGVDTMLAIFGAVSLVVGAVVMLVARLPWTARA